MTYSPAHHEAYESRLLDSHLETSTEYNYRLYKNLPYRLVDGEWMNVVAEEPVSEEEAIAGNDAECERRDNVARENEDRYWREF